MRKSISTPSLSGLSSSQRKKRKITALDISVDDVAEIDPASIGVPELTQDHMYALERAVKAGASCTETRSHRFVNNRTAERLQLLGLTHSGQQLPAIASAFSAGCPTGPGGAGSVASQTTGAASARKKASALPQSEELQARVMAYYKKVHGNSLRVHEELSRNLGINIGDLVFMEQELVKELTAEGRRPPPQLPPVSVMVLYLFTCEEQDMLTLFAKKSVAAADALRAAGNRAELLRALVRERMKAVKLSRDMNEPGSRRNRTILHQEVMRAVEAMDTASLSRWIGTIALLLASINALADEPPSMAEPTRSRPPSAGLAQPSASVDVLSEPEPTDLVGSFVMLFDSAAAALEAVRALASVEPTDTTSPPMFQSLAPAGTPLHTQLVAGKPLQRPADFVERVIGDINEETGLPFTHIEKIAICCSGYITQVEPVLPEPPPQQPGEEPVPLDPVVVAAATEAAKEQTAKLPKKVRVDIVKPRTMPAASVVVSTSQWSRYPKEGELLFAPFASCTVVSFDPARLSVTMKIVVRSFGEMGPFFSSVLDDARKASGVAAAIANRLVQQFVKPHHCHRHPTQQFSHFCHRCRAFICLACAKEVHCDHGLEQVTAFCVAQSVSLEPHKAVILSRLERLRALINGLGAETERMHHLVDTGIDDVIGRLKLRADLLHSDARRRADEQAKQLGREQQNALADQQLIDEAKLVISRVRLGSVAPVPVIKLHERWQVKNSLILKLPTEQLKKLVRVLTWSNPSKYLTNYIYPPDLPQAQTRKQVEKEIDKRRRLKAERVKEVLKGPIKLLMQK